MTAGFSRPHPFSFEVLEEDGARIYAAEVAFARTSPRQHYLCSVMVTAGGRLLDVDAYQRRRTRFERERGRTAESLAGQFPSIGRRAQREFLGFGPGGAGFGLTFTTTGRTKAKRLREVGLIAALDLRHGVNRTPPFIDLLVLVADVNNLRRLGN